MYLLCMKLQPTCCCSCSRYALILLYVCMHGYLSPVHNYYINTLLPSLLFCYQYLSMRLSDKSSHEHKLPVM